MEVIKIEKELKIRNVTTTWETICEKENPIEIVLDDIKNFDGAGMQLIMHLYNISLKNSEKYKITNNSEVLITKLKDFGYIIKKRSEDK